MRHVVPLIHMLHARRWHQKFLETPSGKINRLLLAFAADPEGFFERADLDHSGDLRIAEFARICKEVLPDIEFSAVQT